MKEIDGKGAVVLGVSPDSVASHKKFKEKFNLNFKLLSDEDHKLADVLVNYVGSTEGAKKTVEGIEALGRRALAGAQRHVPALPVPRRVEAGDTSGDARGRSQFLNALTDKALRH